MSKQFYLILITLIAIFTFIGCGSKHTKINIGYSLEEELNSSISNAQNINLYVEQFHDNRGSIEPNIIGEAKTGAFNKATPILIDDSVESISTSNFKDAFSNVGFNVVDNGTLADLVFKGRINRLWVQEFATGYSPEHCEADIEFDVVLINKKLEKQMWFDVKKSHIKSSFTMMDATALNEPTLSKALTDVINSVINDSDFALAVNEFSNAK